MTAQAISIDLEERTVLRKGLAALRKDGLIPAVVHNHGQESIHVAGSYVTLSKVYAAAGKHHPVEVTVGGQTHLALIKDVDFEPTKHLMRHVVFQAIRQNEKTEAEVPIKLVGEIPAERTGLMVLTNLSSVMVEALPKDLPDELLLDATGLTEVGDSLTVADLQVPAGVTVLTEADHGVAVVEMPKDQVAEANAAAEELAADKAASEDESKEEPVVAADSEDKTAADEEE